MADTTETDGRELTYGEKAVGLSFNPSGDPDVTKVKQLYAEIIDLLNSKRGDRKDEGSRHLAIAITDAETAQMRAVKGLTFPVPKV